MLQKAANVKNRIVDTIFPPQCFSCRSFVSNQGSLCSDCWSSINFITSPQCNICGIPFEFEASEEAVCADCMKNNPPFSKARAVFQYDDFSRVLVTRFKYSDKTHMADSYATWMVRAAEKILPDIHFVVPVPLHRYRLITRRYNQAALLANSIGKISGKEVSYNILKRKKFTQSQAGLTFNQRQKNVSGAFVVDKKSCDNIKYKNILLVDDVMTTGATIMACVKVLKKAGAKNVSVLTLARTVKG